MENKWINDEGIDTNDEILDIVDKYDNIIGQKKRSDIYRENLCNFRVVNAFLVNSEGQIWIPRRTLHKRIFPGGLDVSVGGHVESGESYEVALARELKEELDLDIEQIPYRLLGHLSPYNEDVSAFMNVYEIRSDHSPNYNTNDFLEAFWLTPQELLNRIKHEDYSPKGDLPKLIRLFYLDKSTL